MWNWMQETDKLRKAVQSDINEMSRKLHEDLRNRKVEQERLALILSRISPASAYQIAAMNLANTDIHVKSRFEAALEDYQIVLSDYSEKKQKESPGSHGGIQIQFDSETGIRPYAWHVKRGSEAKWPFSDWSGPARRSAAFKRKWCL